MAAHQAPLSLGKVKVKSECQVAQLCLTLCDPMDCSPPSFSIHGIFQARVLEWVAIAFTKAGKWKVKVKSLSRVRLSATPWTAAYQASPSMGFSRQEYWSGVPLPSPCLVTRSCPTLLWPPWTVGHQAPLSMIFQAKILERIAISFSRGSSQPRCQTYISCIGRQVLYHWVTREWWENQVGTCILRRLNFQVKGYSED